tara:strand:- start:640 stop:2793 length:2154 start_codon:yes stop_codon:yes gene_type:complete
MANSFVRYTGNGNTTAYSVPFSYRAQEDVTVTLNGVATTAFTFNGAGTQITFTTAPALDVAIEIRRTTSQGTKLVDYASGSVLTESDLDTDSDQAFFMSQEAIDDASDVIKLSNVNFQWDGQNKRLTNIADPTSAQDAATKNWSETAMSSQLAQATTQATNAATSATNASTSATNASTSETNAASSATAAATSATAAAASETASGTSETNAGTSATQAGTSATAAANSASAAATSATNAASSESSVATNATNAAASASAAATSASNASTSETNAGTSETNAGTSATNAASSATAAASSASAASTSETNAASSASAASTSATNAGTSETNAATSATNAGTSETNAATSATAAQTAQAAAEAAADNFDDTYLGAKASDPTVDNDGDALTAGDLYFNTTTNKMKVYTGSAWLDATASGTEISNVVEDTTPQLGGNLDLNGNDITGTGAIPAANLTGTLPAINGANLTGISTDLVGDTSPQLGGDLDLNSNNITGTGAISCSGDLTVDTDTLKVDSTNNRVGVLTTSPAGVLHVKTAASGATPNTAADELVLEGSGDCGMSFLTGSSSSARIYFGDSENALSGVIKYDHNLNAMMFSTSGAEEMRLESDGDLHVDGDVIAFSTTISDVALKSDIEMIPNALDKIDEVRGVTFTRHNGQKSAGIIAQELEKVLPEAVREKKLALHDGKEYKTVEYDAIHGLLINCIKELKEEIKELKDGFTK